jgi:copper chaperone CopZ
MKRLLATFCLTGPLLAAAAENRAPQPQTITHRVFGLFQPFRQDDLRTAIDKIPDVKLLSIDFAHGEATFSYDPAIAFKGTKADKIVERFDNLLRSAASPPRTFGILPLCSVPKDKLTPIEIAVAGLDCKACGFAAYQIIAKIDGVAQATASFQDGKITALIDPEKTSRAALEEALKKREVKVLPPKTNADQK